jgi:Fe-S-cluster-containing hydrogenase component 2
MVACPFGVMQIVLTPVQEGESKRRRINAICAAVAKRGPPAYKTARPKRWCWQRTARW